MPTYEFACPAGHQFTRFYRKMSDAVSELPCPECGQTATRKISGGAGLLFKGSGFYITDYGKDGKKGASPAAGERVGSDSKTGDAGTAKSGSDASPAAGASRPDSATKSASAPADRSSGSAAKKGKSTE
ncbi:MAG TPA: zinc ribbon domain-containing protein [Gemmatimonadaceae bacterium]|nr:zinc ribbon domain-containing protein [Gemmatimonadaceae bacterium]